MGEQMYSDVVLGIFICILYRNHVFAKRDIYENHGDRPISITTINDIQFEWGRNWKKKQKTKNLDEKNIHATMDELKFYSSAESCLPTQTQATIITDNNLIL